MPLICPLLQLQSLSILLIMTIFKCESTSQCLLTYHYPVHLSRNPFLLLASDFKCALIVFQSQSLSQTTLKYPSLISSIYHPHLTHPHISFNFVGHADHKVAFSLFPFSLQSARTAQVVLPDIVWLQLQRTQLTPSILKWGSKVTLCFYFF